MDYMSAFQSVITDPRYVKNLDWGEPRPGHPEGTVRAHIAELEANLEALRPKLTETEVWKLKLLIHTHDSFKAQAKPEAAITDPASHASFARAFLAEFCDDAELLEMVQYHDDPFALWRQVKHKGACNPSRLATLTGRRWDWNLFLAFLIIDGGTDGKSRLPLRWFFKELEGRVTSRFTAEDIID